ncbi:hypothetical protein [Geothrix sp. PMB-07]|uniref:hypothetical protein n=1 Tax=Geothrix sp. PMB-07 TaxID=3068640 RepID=UPI002742652F|nr:hypothetical protein [Geothrix sp. PMB-07]WLT31449.1 hypothetical protein Q9293_17200 [Geothrix sp. PMB-07]
MAVSTGLAVFRALLTAHAQTSWNRSAREMGRQGTLVLVILTCLVGLFAIGPLFLGLGGLGWVLGSNFHKPLAPVFLGLALALISIGGGLFGGIIGGARQLNWETYRGFPLKLRTLYLAELVAGLGDPLPLILGLGLLAFLVGLGLGSPASIPGLPLLFLETLGALLALQLLVGGLAAALVKRLRMALVLLGAVAWVATTLATAQLPQKSRKKETPAVQIAPTDHAAQRAQLDSLVERGTRLVSVLPTHAAAQSLADARAGRWGLGLLRHAYPLALLALLMVLGARLVARESRDEGASKAASRGPDKLWSFSGPAEGVGRLHFRTLMASQLGRFAFLMPIMTLVLLKGPFAQLRGQSLWAVPAAFAYLSLVGNNVMLNQFGLDRHGIKAMLLLPIPAQDLLKGKLLGMAAHQGLQALLLMILLAVFEHAALGPLFAGLLMLGCVFLAQSAVGQWTSLWAPRPMALDSLKNSNMPFAVGMLSLATASLWTGLFGGLYALVAWVAPVWLVPVMALAFLLVLAAHLALLPTMARYLDARREVLVERLG